VAAQATRSFLFGVSVLDPWTIVCTVAGLLAIGVIATWPPVAQAIRVRTLETLREE
jgi:ABC-type lipoprotein release transport system permease subunit